MSESRGSGKRYAVLVGPTKYDHSKLDSLQFTENDVTEPGEILREGGYDIRLLTETTGILEAGIGLSSRPPRGG
jgi:hypothetical protein